MLRFLSAASRGLTDPHLIETGDEKWGIELGWVKVR